jgi:triacylglycerol esterase/lipase EstA (alpha/beta hydrolase family)
MGENALKAKGYCVFALDYGERGTGPIEDSAAALRDFVGRVLAATGAAKVSLVGHSQGRRRLRRLRPLDLTEHLGIIYDAPALQWVENALGRAGPADASFRPRCL